MSRFPFTIARVIGWRRPWPSSSAPTGSTRSSAWSCSSRPAWDSRASCSATISPTCSTGLWITWHARSAGWAWSCWASGSSRPPPSCSSTPPPSRRPHGHIARDPSRVLSALQRRRGLCGGLAELGPDGRQPVRAAQHAHRAVLATGDLGPGGLCRGPGALPDVLAIASYAILVAVMLMTGRLVARETGRPARAWRRWRWWARRR